MKKNIIFLTLFLSVSSLSGECPKVFVVNAESEIGCYGCLKSWYARPKKNFVNSLEKAGYVIVANEKEADLLAKQKLGESRISYNGRSYDGAVWSELIIQLVDKTSGKTVEESIMPFKYNDLAGDIIPRRIIKATREGVAKFKGCDK